VIGTLGKSTLNGWFCSLWPRGRGYPSRRFGAFCRGNDLQIMLNGIYIINSWKGELENRLERKWDDSFFGDFSSEAKRGGERHGSILGLSLKG